MVEDAIVMSAEFDGSELLENRENAKTNPPLGIAEWWS